MGVLGGTGKTVSVPVAGVYRDLAAAPLPGFWCSVAGDIIPSNAFSNAAPPAPIVLADRTLLLELADQLGTMGQVLLWEFPVDEHGLTLEEAGPTSDSLAAIADRLMAALVPTGIEPKSSSPSQTAISTSSHR